MLNLVVIRVSDIERAREFYETIGLEFERHQHGTGLPHFASVDKDGTGVTFEIYPSAGKSTVDTRLGFRVSDVDRIVETLAAQGGSIIVTPKDSPWGRRAVMQDLDGHKVELCDGGISDNPLPV